MKSSTLVQYLLITFAAVAVASPHDSSNNIAARVNHRRHGSHARSHGSISRRCKPRDTKKADNSGAAAPEPEQNNKSNDGEEKKDSEKDNNKGNGSTQSQGGLIAVKVDRCGDSGATSDVTKTTGPNGSIDFLNCGIDQGSWNPPNIAVGDLKTVDLHEALKDSNSPFQACTDFIDIFQRAADKHGMPPIILASIAMQESSCKPGTVGGAGEQGLMQLTEDKCGGAPGGDCKNPEFNIMTGANYLQGQLDAHNGNFLLALGSYNGWEEGMSLDQAKTRFGGNCRTQRNLDYLFQNLNVWYQNISAYSGTKYGKYFNLDSC